MQRVTEAMCVKTAGDALKTAAGPSAQCTLRPASIADIDDILKIGRESFSYNAPTRAEIRHAVSHLHGALMVLCERMAIVGYVLIEAHLGRKNLYLNTVAISAARRGQGLSPLLYRFADMLAQACSARNIVAHVADGNDIAAYMLQKSGYAFLRREEAYYSDGNAGLTYRKVLI